MSVYRDQAVVGTPDVLIVSGLDPSGGAGFLADARVVHMLGGRPVGAITTMTIQSTTGLRSAHEIDIDVLGAQLNALLTDIEVKAVKVGMLADRDIIDVLDEAFDLTNAPIVWDPIAAPTRGQVSFGREVLEAALRKLAPHLALITPNTNELAILAGTEITSLVEAVDAARGLARVSNVAVLLTGGHLATLAGARRAELGGLDSRRAELAAQDGGARRDEVANARDGVADDGVERTAHVADVATEAIDALCTPDGEVEYLRGARIVGDDVHGTGCALSSAIATYLALGHPLLAACREAKQFVAERIASPVRPGRGAPAVL